MDGKITGSAYSGTASYTQDALTAGTAADLTHPGTGQMVGGFYGANAAETAGALQVHGAQPTGSACATADCLVQGAFGAKKSP